MSTAACTEFLRAVHRSPELQQQLKAVTGTREMVAFGRRRGYTFDLQDLVTASTAFNQEAAQEAGPAAPAAPSRHRASEPAAPAEQPRGTRFLHYEFQLADLPGFDNVTRELPSLEIQPPSVDLDEFAAGFRAEDLESTSMSPAAPSFQRWYEDMMRVHWQDPAADGRATRRDFHLVNLDEHVDHPGYDRYFDAKSRVISFLEDFFGTEIRFSGSLWYPPSSYRLWHTNETQPGWRMYVVDVDRPFADPEHTSFFRYLNPQTGQIVTLREKPRIVRFFRAEQERDRLFWHCIVNPTDRHRWSYGFVVPDSWMQRIPSHLLSGQR